MHLREPSDSARCAWENCIFPASKRVPLTLCDDHVLLVATVLNEDECKVEPSPTRQSALIGNVYYVRCGDRLKVGYTTDLRRRISQYPPGSELLAVQPGTIADERATHSLLSAHRLEGREWYALNDETLAHVVDVIVKHGEPPKINGRKQTGRQKPTLQAKYGARHVS